ncbi:MAG: hypothetical protein Q4A46_09830, partial [Clostridia bacterium]|nr:hypothetical protein [Clostridia bacterium]
FELGVKPYTDTALLSMRHQKDEVRTGTYITLSAFQMGVGTGSCGPETFEHYRVKAQDYSFEFELVPYFEAGAEPERMYREF